MKTFEFSFSLSAWKPLALAALVVSVLAACTSTTSAPERDSSLNPGQSGSGTRGTADTGNTHTVRPGETMNMIARQYGLSASNIAAWNGIANPNLISVGQVLRLSPPAGGESGVETRPIGNSAPEAVEVKPMGSSGSAAGVTQGGKVPYSDAAWAKAHGGSEPAPAADKPVEAAGTAGNGEWIWPVSGKVTSGFSETANMKGLDLAAKAGDPVLAARGGRVAYAGGGLRGYGKLVIISHDGDYLSAYAHNQNILVKEGDVVKQGQKIAEAGSTDTDKPKLHFEIRKQGRPVDPIKYLPAR